MLKFIKKLFKKEKLNYTVNPAILKKDLKQYSKKSLINMIAKMGESILYYEKKFGKRGIV